MLRIGRVGRRGTLLVYVQGVTLVHEIVHNALINSSKKLSSAKFVVPVFRSECEQLAFVTPIVYVYVHVCVHGRPDMATFQNISSPFSLSHTHTHMRAPSNTLHTKVLMREEMQLGSFSLRGFNGTFRGQSSKSPRGGPRAREEKGKEGLRAEPKGQNYP